MLQRIRFVNKYNGFIVYESPDYEGVVGIATIDDERAIVYNNDKCYDYPTDEFYALLEHEIGHVVLNHEKYERNLENEIEADLYSVEQVGVEVNIRALERTLKMEEDLKRESSVNEILKRIEYLKDYKNEGDGH